ncbi:MAG TPA: glycine cleavage system protein GcvH [Candidatus Limnocylindrales bacterium]|nr:glycine cleavage system protein GcvH [Candidatus Limnocylindrales bacterium]
MSDASGLRFLESHEWVRQEGDRATIGVSDYAQSQLGDVIYLELPAVGHRVEAGARFGVVESVKAASDLYSPVGGEVAEVNEALKEHPEYVNEDPYGKGWILKLRNVTANPKLLDQSAYQRLTEGEQH